MMHASHQYPWPAPALSRISAR